MEVGLFCQNKIKLVKLVKSHCRYKINELSGVFSLVLGYAEMKHSQQCAATVKTWVHSLKTQVIISCVLAGNIVNQDHLGGKDMQKLPGFSQTYCT